MVLPEALNYMPITMISITSKELEPTCISEDNITCGARSGEETGRRKASFSLVDLSRGNYVKQYNLHPYTF